MDRLPANQAVDKDAIGESFIELLEKKRSEYLTPEGPKKKRNKLQLSAGKSVSLQEVQAAITENSKSNKPSTSKKLSAPKKSSTHSKLLNKKSRGRVDSSSSEEDFETMVLESDGVSETFSDIEEMILEKSGKAASTGAHKENNRPEMKPEDFAIDNFVIVNYNGQKYTGKILSVTDSGLSVECMEKKRKC